MTSTTPRQERPDMAAYGVPAQLDGVLDWSWAAERLAATRNFWLTTVDPGGRPHSMPLWGWWDDEGVTGAQCFWFSCAPESLKVRNLAANPAVVVAIDDTVEVVSIEGDASRMTGDDAATLTAARAWVDRYADDLGADDETKAAEAVAFFAGGAAYRVVPRKAFGLIERPDDFGPRATRWRW